MGYSIRLRLGDHVWNIDENDGDLSTPAVLAGLSFTWSAPQDRGWPPPGAMPFTTNVLPFDTLSVSVLADAAEDVADIARNQVCHFTFTPDGYADPLCEFAGRLGDPSIVPRLVGDEHAGVYLTVSASDYRVDLTTRSYITTGTSTLADSADRMYVSIRNISTLLGYGSMFLAPDATLDAIFGFPAFDIVVEGAITDMDVFRALGFVPLPNYDANGDLDATHPFLYPLLPTPAAPSTDPAVNQYGLDPILASPYELGVVGGLLTIVGGGLPANLVPTESLTWSRDREPNYAELDSGAVGVLTYWRGQQDGAPIPGPLTRRTVRGRLDDVNYQSIQLDVEEAPYGPERFVVLGYLDPSVVDGWLNYPARVFTVVNMAGLDPQQNPTGGTWVAGMLGSARLVIPANGKWYVEGLMRRSRPNSSTRDYVTADLTYDDIAADFPAVTYADIDPTLTYRNLDLIGG